MIKTTKKCFRLYHPGDDTWGGLEFSSNGDRDFCGDQTVKLDMSPKPSRLWEMESEEKMLLAIYTDEQWYNSSETTPIIPFDLEDLGEYMIVECEIEEKFTPRPINTDKYFLARSVFGMDCYPHDIDYDKGVRGWIHGSKSAKEQQDWIEQIGPYMGKIAVFDGWHPYKLIRIDYDMKTNMPMVICQKVDI